MLPGGRERRKEGEIARERERREKKRERKEGGGWGRERGEGGKKEDVQDEHPKMYP